MAQLGQMHTPNAVNLHTGQAPKPRNVPKEITAIYELILTL